MRTQPYSLQASITSKTTWLSLVLVCLLALAFSTACANNNQTESAPSATASATDGTDERTLQVSLSITCEEAVAEGNQTALAISEDGLIFDESLELAEGATVIDALKASGVAVGLTESSLGEYVSSLGGLAELDAGPMSGWTYAVNGEDAQVAADQFELKEGDRVEWRYVVDFSAETT